MVWRPTHHRLIRLTAILIPLLFAVGLSGCTATPAPKPAPDLAVRLNSALAGGQTAFSALFSPAQLGASWYSVLSQSATTFTPDGDDPGAVIVATTLPGDRRSAKDSLTLDLDADGAIRGITNTGVRPIWTLNDIHLRAATHGTVASAGLTSAAQSTWAARLDRASAAVAAAGVLAPAEHWDGGLVVEIPADAAGFTATTSGSAQDTSAITICTSGTPRIVVNPASFSQSADWLQATLTHEAVHVATESPCHTGVAWVVEGVAESVAAASDPATAKANASLVRTYLRGNPLPSDLPASPVTPTDYALAQVGVDQVRRRLGSSAPDFIARGINGQLTNAELTMATGWYLTELRRR